MTDDLEFMRALCEAGYISVADYAKAKAAAAMSKAVNRPPLKLATSSDNDSPPRTLMKG